MIVGLVEIPALPHSNLDIIHKIASGLDIDGYTVRRISIFEDPLIANIHIETNSFTHCNKSMSLFPKKTRLIDISQSLYIDLSFRHSAKLPIRRHLSYSIKVDKIRARNTAVASIMKEARHVTDQLLFTFNRLTSSKLVFSSMHGS